MLDPPDLPNDRIVASVRRHYGLDLTTLAFLPLGQDVLAWTYRAATADVATYFLKLRQGAVNQAGLCVPRYLVDHGVTHVVAPLPARGRRLWVDADGYTLTLYPFITGTTGGAHGLQEHHWVTYGAAIREFHDAPLTPELSRDVPRETFTSRWTEVVRAVEAQITRRTPPDPITRDLAAVWQEKRAEIEALVVRFDALGQRLRTMRPELVLCHADIHHNNVLIDTDDRFWIVDWDDTLLAPKECDLMMGVGGLNAEVVGPREEAWFLKGYGTTVIDPIALAYYRHFRAVSDLGYNAEQVCFMSSIGEATRRNAVQRTMKLFTPGSIVTLAEQLERFAT